MISMQACMSRLFHRMPVHKEAATPQFRLINRDHLKQMQQHPQQNSVLRKASVSTR